MFKTCLQNDKIVKKSAQLEGTDLPKNKSKQMKNLFNNEWTERIIAGI